MTVCKQNIIKWMFFATLSTQLCALTNQAFAEHPLPWNAPENNPSVSSSPSVAADAPQTPNYKPQPQLANPEPTNNDAPPRQITQGTAPHLTTPPNNSGQTVYRNPNNYGTPNNYRNTNQPLAAHTKDFNSSEITQAGHRFFGSISVGMAKIIEYAFSSQGRPNGYILGEEAGGAFIAGVRYGEGTLYTKNAGTYKVFWQGPSIGYDFGAEGSKIMVLVYNLNNPQQIYQTFSGVAGSAYFIGGVGITLQTGQTVTTAPIRSGIGFRVGANIGYVKYTHTPTWNPF